MAKLFNSKQGQFDTELVTLIIIMLLFGLVMVVSASSVTALYHQGDSLFFAKKQLLVAVAGIICMFIISRMDYHELVKLTLPLIGITFVLLVAVRIFGEEVSGARRWFNIGGLSFQPSEVAKIVIIMLFALLYSNQKEEDIKKFKTGIMRYFIIIGVTCGLLLLQPHKSAATLITIVCMIIMMAAGVRLRQLFFPLLGIIPLAAFIFIKDKYSLLRLTSFADPFKDAAGSGWQAIQSLYAIGSGGIFGLGLGRSRQKFLYIPEPHNDFIFSIICEELGFIGAFSVIVLFVLFIVRCVSVAMKAPDTLGSLLAIGITALMATQAIINIAVVTALMPVTGMPLPMFSAGGTSLLFVLSSMGILLNISRHAKKGVGGRGSQ